MHVSKRTVQEMDNGALGVIVHNIVLPVSVLHSSVRAAIPNDLWRNQGLATG